MLSITKKIGRRFKHLSLLAMVALLAIAAPQLASATGANHIVKNTVTVNYNNALGAAQAPVTASVNFTVALVLANPTVTTDATTATVAASTLVTFTYTITSNANGPELYNFAPTGTSTSGITTPGAITLGATTVFSADPYAAGKTVLNVPADGVNDGVVNGIAATDTVVIGGTAYVVVAVNDTNGGTANANSTITVTGDASAAALGATIFERQSVTATFTTPAAIITDQLLLSGMVVTANSDGTKTATSADVTTTVTGLGAANLTVAKFVANLTTPVVGGGVTNTYGAVTYYTTGVTGKPTDVMGYLVVITNGGAGDAQNVVVTDPMPAYTTYKAGTLKLGGVALTDVATDTDAGEANTTTNEITVFAGTGGAGDGITYGVGTGGILNPAQVSYVTFSATID